MNTNPIGVLDSGVGSLSIVRSIIPELSHESIITIADSLHAPYGSKSTEFIRQRAELMIEYLLAKKAKLIVIACNTITVTCLDYLRDKHPDVSIVGVVPVIKTAVEKTRNGRIGVLSTTTTAQSRYQKELIKRFASNCTVFNHGTDALVPLIEAGELDSIDLQQAISEALSQFDTESIDTLALGCTHFPLIREQLMKALGHSVQLLDSGDAVARQVRRLLSSKNALSSVSPSYQFVTTGDVGIAKKIIHATIDKSVLQNLVVQNVEL